MLHNLRASKRKLRFGLQFSTGKPSTAAHLDAKARIRTQHSNFITNSSATRPVPSPSFQRPSPASVAKVAQLNTNEPLDESFVGLTGGQIFHEMMLRHNVKHIFGYPGGAILPVFDAIYNSPHFKFTLPRHEQGAGHMAEGYARVTGLPGVVLVTSGPGATNIITPMADAYMDGTPMVVFSGQVATAALGSDAFQEADILGISRSCTKWNVMVRDIAEMPRRINEAFKIATTGRPGPVLVDLPKDVTAAILKTGLPFSVTRPNITPYLPTTASASSHIDHAAIKHAADMINSAKNPIIYAGAGCQTCPELLERLSAEGNIPVTTTLQGLGSFDELNPKSLHMLGMHGSAYANLAMQDADVIIALGARFDDRVTGKVDTFAPAARAAALNGTGGIIHFEILPKNINKVVDATIAITGLLETNLEALLPLIKSSDRRDWFEKLAGWKKRYPFAFESSNPKERMKPQEVIEELDKQTKEYKKDVVITTGVGQHQMWAAQHFRWRRSKGWISSGGLGTMGFGLPAAIGAKTARPDLTVIDIDGDASFSMTAMELATAHQYNVGVKILILNNDFQGMVQQWQDLFYEKRYSNTRMTNPDFVKLAESMGVKALRCHNAEELPAKMKEFLEYDGQRPILMDCQVVQTEHVLPMVAAGKALHEQIVHPLLKDGVPAKTESSGAHTSPAALT